MNCHKKSRAAVRNWIAIVVSLFGSVSAVAANKPAISFDGKDVVAQVNAGASVVLISVAREFNGWATALVKTATILRDDDRDGIVRYTYPGPALPKSFWAVIDLESGDYEIAMPHDWKVARRPIPAAAFVARGPARLGVLADQRETYVAIIRPGLGAWTGTAVDGALSDEDAMLDNRILVRLEHLRPVGSSSPAAPSTLERGDIVFYADPATLSVSEGRVAR